MIGDHGTVLTVFTVLEESGNSLFSDWLPDKTIAKQWKQWASRFFQNSENSENSELPDSSKTVKTVKTVSF